MRRAVSLEKTFMLGKIEGRRRRGRQRMRWLDGISNSRTWVWVDSRSWWWTRRPGVLWLMGKSNWGIKFTGLCEIWLTEISSALMLTTSLETGSWAPGQLCDQAELSQLSACSRKGASEWSTAHSAKAAVPWSIHPALMAPWVSISLISYSVLKHLMKVFWLWKGNCQYWLDFQIFRIGRCYMCRSHAKRSDKSILS